MLELAALFARTVTTLRVLSRTRTAQLVRLDTQFLLGKMLELALVIPALVVSQLMGR